MVIYQRKETVSWPPIALIHWRLKSSTAGRSPSHRRGPGCYLEPRVLSSGKDSPLLGCARAVCRPACSHPQCLRRHPPAGPRALGCSGNPLRGLAGVLVMAPASPWWHLVAGSSTFSQLKAQLDSGPAYTRTRADRMRVRRTCRIRSKISNKAKFSS